MTEKKCTTCGVVKSLHEYGPRQDIVGAKKSSCRKCDCESQRRRYEADKERMRKLKAESMSRARRDPVRSEKIKISSRKCYRNGGAAKQKARWKRLQTEEPFRWRAYLIRRHNPSITAAMLEAMWATQNGRCGLTGLAMDIQEADIDHIVPLCRGGSSDISNLRWVRRVANAAKDGLLDEEFIALCRDVVSHLGAK